MPTITGEVKRQYSDGMRVLRVHRKVQEPCIKVRIVDVNSSRTRTAPNPGWRPAPD
ncbi:hypothetical protein GCM10022207_78530 [Streptomyces lannensis]|uniref:Transposase n=1 Tax=Streptomyces lannensis TaxID=766498 RepID=A0ABP7LFG6_9ACTN